MSNYWSQGNGQEQTVAAEEAGMVSRVEKIIFADGLTAGVYTPV